MALRILADSLDELPEPLRANAKQEGSGVVLDAFPSGWGVDNVNSLKKEIAELRDDARRKQKHLDSLRREDGSLWDVAQLRADAEEAARLREQLKGGKGDMQKQIEEAVAQAKRDLAQQLEKVSKERDTIAQRFRGDKKRAAAMAALMKAQPIEEYQGLLLDRLEQLLDVVDEDGKIDVRVKQDSGEGYRLSQAANNNSWMSPEEYATSIMRQSLPKLFRGDEASGAGANNSRGNAAAGRVRIAQTASQAEYRQAKQEAQKIAGDKWSSVLDIV